MYCSWIQLSLASNANNNMDDNNNKTSKVNIECMGDCDFERSIGLEKRYTNAAQ